jgi:hypothetical protein
MIPIAGPVASALYGAFFTEARYDDDIRVSPIESIVGSAVKSGGAAAGAFFSGEDLSDAQKRQAAMDALNILGIAANLPIGALKRPLGFLFDVESGKQEPEDLADYARGLVTGRMRRQE